MHSTAEGRYVWETHLSRSCESQPKHARPSRIRILHKPIRVRIIHEIRNVELAVRVAFQSLELGPTITIVGRANQTGISTRRQRQTGHIEEVENVQVFQLVRSRGASGRDGFQFGVGGFGLAGDEEVEVLGAAAHVGQNADGGGSLANAVHAWRRALAVVVLFEDAR